MFITLTKINLTIGCVILLCSLLIANTLSTTHSCSQSKRLHDHVQNVGKPLTHTPDRSAVQPVSQDTEGKGLLVLFNVSAYCQDSCCTGSFADGVTASGHVIQPGDHFIAAPKRYPFGTKMIIPGYNNGRPVEVKDRGGAIKGNKIDLFFGDKDGVSGHQRALNWGRQHIYVEILP